MKWYIQLSLCFITCYISGHSLQSWQADRAYKQGDLEKARQLYACAVEQDPTDMQALYNVAKVAYKQKDFSTAQKAFEKVAQASSNSNTELAQQAYFNLGDTLVQQKEYSKALDMYNKILTINPDNNHAKKRIEYIKKLLEQQEDKQENKKDNSAPQENKNQDNKSADQQDSKGQEMADNNKGEQEDHKNDSQQAKQQTSDNNKAKQDERPQGAKNSASQQSENAQANKTDKEQGNKTQQKNTQHETSTSANIKKNDTPSNAQSQLLENTKKADAVLTGHEKALLDSIEKHDGALRKALVNAYVSNTDNNTQDIYDKNW